MSDAKQIGTTVQATHFLFMFTQLALASIKLIVLSLFTTF